MNSLVYTLDQVDALHEVANIAMGLAGASLALMLGSFVRLSVPRSEIVGVEDAAAAVASLLQSETAITGVRQAFFNGLRGEVLLLYPVGSSSEVADLMGHDGPLDRCAEDEVLLDISSLLTGAVLNGLAQQLDTEFGFSAPSILARECRAEDLLKPEQVGWARALLIEVKFSLEARDFRCHLILLMPEESIGRMRAVLDRMLADL